MFQQVKIPISLFFRFRDSKQFFSNGLSILIDVVGNEKDIVHRIKVGVVADGIIIITTQGVCFIILW